MSVVGIDEVDLDRHHISWRSPLARALMNSGPGAALSFARRALQQRDPRGALPAHPGETFQRTTRRRVRPEGASVWRLASPDPRSAYTFDRGEVISSECHHLRRRNRWVRNELAEGLLRRRRVGRWVHVGSGSAALGQTPASGQAPGHDHPMIKGSKELIAYGDRSRFVTSVRIAHPVGSGPSPTRSGRCSTWPRRCRILLA